MKVLKLRLKNFTHIYSGLSKREVLLDFTENDKLINIIIGKMGSCKTVILGHLQPFASFGTLDIRNQDDIIIPGEDGLKNIVYINDGVIYDIVHRYTWNEKAQSHSVKSYIERNGEELNENGNVTSFKAIIKDEFGIEQSLLRLFRLGSNVTNLIDLRSTERKTFVSALMTDTSVYEMLYKKLKEDVKKLNAQVSILTNRANSLTNESIDVLENRLADIEENIEGLEYSVKEYEKSIYLIEAESKAILAGYDSLDSYVSRYEALDSVIKKEKQRYSEVKKAFDKMVDLPTDIEVAKSIGSIEGQIEYINTQIEDITKDLEALENLIIITNDKKNTFCSDTQLKMLRANYEQAVANYNEYKEHASYIDVDMTSNQIQIFQKELNTFCTKIDELKANSLGLLNTVANSDATILLSVKGESAKLSNQKLRLQRELNNIEYSASYTCSDFLVIPPGCPAKRNCPYVQTHPATIGTGTDNNEARKKRKMINDQIAIIDVKLDEYMQYPVIFSQVNAIRGLWRTIQPTMEKLDLLILHDVNTIITSSTDWYNSQRLSEIVEAIEKKEKLSDMADNIVKMKEILDINSIVQVDDLQAELDRYIKDRDQIADQIVQLNNDKKDLYNEMAKLQDLHMKVIERDRLKLELEELTTSKEDNIAEFNNLSANIDKIYENKKLVDSIDPKLHRTKTDLIRTRQSRDNLRILINDVNNTASELDALVIEQRFLKLLITAVSPSEGIPLIYVERFLDSCREIMNDLISDVFSDQIVIQKFIINEDEFRIPYTMNGTLISDISYCSQGQKAIVALALSFAMIRQAIEGSDSSFIYNIMALDEVDGALYKSSRNDFINVLFKQLRAIKAEQAFLISHNNTFDGFDVNIIMTTDEIVDESPLISIMKV